MNLWMFVLSERKDIIWAIIRVSWASQSLNKIKHHSAMDVKYESFLILS